MKFGFRKGRAPWADVNSYIPYRGRVDVKLKKSCRSVGLRAPEWVDAHSPQVGCRVNGVTRALHWEGRYLDLGEAEAGDTMVTTFPIAERTIRERIGAETYTLILKGNTLVSIDPRGQSAPLYQGREKYRSSEVQWSKVDSFVAHQPI